MSDTTLSNRVRDILNAAPDDLTPDVVYTAIQVAERRRDRADDDIRLLNAKFVEVSMARSEDTCKVVMPSLETLRKLSQKDGNAAILAARGGSRTTT